MSRIRQLWEFVGCDESIVTQSSDTNSLHAEDPHWFKHVGKP